MPKSIHKSVGQGGANATAKDIMTVQYLLNCVPANQGGPTPELAVDGIVGPKTIAAIVGFQSRLTPAPDGRVDPGGPTITCLRKYDPYPMQPMPAVPRPGRSSPAGKAFESGKAGFEGRFGGKGAAGEIFESGKAGYKQAMAGKAAAGKSFEAGMAAYNGWKSQLAAIDQIFDAGMEGMKDLIGSLRKHAASKASGKPQLTPEAKAMAAKYLAVKAAGAKGAAVSNAAKSAAAKGLETKGAGAKGAGVKPVLNAKGLPSQPAGLSVDQRQFVLHKAMAIERARKIQDPQLRQIAMQQAMAMKPPNR